MLTQNDDDNDDNCGEGGGDNNDYNTIQYNTWLAQCPAYNENGTARHYNVNK